MKTIVTTSLAVFWSFVGIVAFCSNGCSITEGADKSPQQEPTTMTLTDVAKHASNDDCWIVIDGRVYDVSAYIKRHPTPPTVITAHCGKDATEAYRTKGGAGRQHSASADEELTKLQVGRVAN